ncbi:MAG TPA: hypothetical protein VII03_02310 [Solirubrobacteraceae bacterium]
MSRRRLIALIACLSALLAPAGSADGYSVGTRAQIEWVRRAASNFVSAELARNGAGACAILNAPLRVTLRHRTCAQRWDARLAAMSRAPGRRAQLRRQLREIATGAVVIHGDRATLGLSSPLFNGPNRFLWTENCWMLEG